MLTEYEEAVIKEIAHHIVQPNLVQKALAQAGKPVAFILDQARSLKYFDMVSKKIDYAIEKCLRGSVLLANKTYTEASVLSEFAKAGLDVSYGEVKDSKLEIKDKVADSFSVSNGVILGAEGAAMGAATTLCEGIPGAQLLIPTLIAADVSSSMVFLSRQICQIATSYGYASTDPQNIPHLIAAMAPQTDTSDEGYFAAKAAVLEMNRAASMFSGQFTGRRLQEAMAKGELPGLIRTIAYVAKRLGVVITQKELGMLVPIAGALINGSVNVAFQQVGHATAKDYFRKMHLINRHGEEQITQKISREIEKLKGS